MPDVHPSADVSPESELANDCIVGPGCRLIGPVRIGAGVRLIGPCVIQGPVTIGAGTTIYPFASIGFPPQDYKFGPDDVTAGVEIGEGCLIRENVTIHAASNDQTPTKIGDRVFMMVQSHAGHDVRVGNDVVIVNGSVLGGHATVGDRANISGLVAIHQFVRVGRLAMVSGGTAHSMDIPPFCMAAERNRIVGLNLVGLRRSGVPRDEIAALREAFKAALYKNLSREEQLGVLGEMRDRSPLIAELHEFVATAKRSISAGPMRPPRAAAWIRGAVKDGIAFDKLGIEGDVEDEVDLT
ncbi:MAG: acyl-ACP--UDP-N-acetylglucosamine O-acyltransferase [Planctomycetota bacterium]